MPRQPLTLVLNRGGLAGLVATSAALAAEEANPGPPRVGLVFVHDGRDDAAVRREAVRRQADFFGLTRLDELVLPGLFGGAAGGGAAGGRPRLAAARLLLEALAHAGGQKADTLLWPVACDARPDDVSRATETQLLAEQLADLEEPAAGGPGANPRLFAPLLGYTDTQVVELGRGYGAPFALARTCEQFMTGAAGPAGPADGIDAPPCRMCPPCRRRAAAFRAAGVADLAPTSRG